MRVTRFTGLGAWLIVSRNSGATWSAARQLAADYYYYYYYCAHRLPQTSLHFSTDECRTWSENVAIDSVSGADSSMAALQDGSILVAYYEEGPGSSIRAKRFRASSQGIAWLEWYE